jgi:hypothetical protein
MKADLGVGRLVKLTKGIDLSRPRHEIVIIVIGLVTFWVGVALKLFI